MFAAWTAASVYRVKLCDVDIAAALRLATANNLFAYDAYMLQCAVENAASLVTLDKQLAKAGRLIGLDIVET